MLSTRKKDDGKPWNGCISLISYMLSPTLDDAFREAFTEGHGKPNLNDHPRELLQFRIFEDIYRELFRNSDEFTGLEELDEHYDRICSDDNIQAFLAEFNQRQSTRTVLTKHASLTESILPYRLEMLKKIMKLYHALMRMGYMLEMLNRFEDVASCAARIKVLHQTSFANAVPVSPDAIETLREYILHPLIASNEHLIRIMQNRHFGVMEFPELVRLQRDLADADKLYIAVHKPLEQLPSVTDIAVMVQRKVANLPPEREGLTLEAYAQIIGDARCFLQTTSASIVEGSRQQQEQFSGKLAGLRELTVNELSDDTLDDFIELHTAVSNQLQALQQAFVEFEKQMDSQAATPLKPVEKTVLGTLRQVLPKNMSDNVWKRAKDQIAPHVYSIMQTTEHALSQYQPCLALYQEAKTCHRNLARQFQPAQQLIEEWGVVNAQSLRIIADMQDKLGPVEHNVRLIAMAPPHEIVAFIKRHWREMTISMTAGAGASVALGFWLLGAFALGSFVALPVAGVALGAVGVGLVASKVRDRISPPEAQPNEQAGLALQALAAANVPAIQPIQVIVLAEAPPPVTGLRGWLPSFFGGSGASAGNADISEPLLKKDGPPQ